MVSFKKIDRHKKNSKKAIVNEQEFFAPFWKQKLQKLKTLDYI